MLRLTHPCRVRGASAATAAAGRLAMAAAPTPSTLPSLAATCQARPATALPRLVRCFSGLASEQQRSGWYPKRASDSSSQGDASASGGSSTASKARVSDDAGAPFTLRDAGRGAPRAPRGRAAFAAAHAPKPLDPDRSHPRNPLQRLQTPEPDDLTKVFGNLSINWYPGHMAAAKAALAERVSKCHLVLEIPFSSGNPDFERLLQHRKKILVFNKTDVADPRSFGPLRRYFEARGQPVMLMAGDPYRPARLNKRTLNGPNTAAAQTGVNRAQMRALHALIADTLGPRRFQSVPPVVLVVGLPNTGKSTLINQFRLFGKLGAASNASKKLDDPTKEVTDKMQGGGVAKVGPTPGLTRSINGFLVSASKLAEGATPTGRHPAAAAARPSAAATDKLFLLDSPGIMLPYIASDHAGVSLGLKLGVVAALKEQIVGEEVLARFALWTLNQSSEFAYVRMLDMEGPTTSLPTLLWAIWKSQYANKQAGGGGGGSKSELFKQFNKAARQRRRWQERDEAAGLIEEDEEDAAARTRARAQLLAEEATPAELPAVAPLRFELPDMATTAPAAAASSAAPSPAPTSPSDLSFLDAPHPTSLSELSSEEALLCTNWFLKKFRRGELGKVTLDHIPREQHTQAHTDKPRAARTDSR